MKKIRKGFTLIEMVIVLFIISLLLLIMIPNLVQQKDHADKQSTEAFKTTLVTQAGLYLENEKTDKENGVESADDSKESAQNLFDKKYITVGQLKRAEKLIGKDADILEKTTSPTTPSDPPANH